jgi:hypothetical protein
MNEESLRPWAIVTFRWRQSQELGFINMGSILHERPWNSIYVYALGFLGGSRQPLRIKAKEFANVEQSLGRACHPSFKVFSNRILRNNPTCLQFLIVKKMRTYAREKVPFATVVRCWKHGQCESIINGNNQVLNCLQSLVVYQGSLLHT